MVFMKKNYNKILKSFSLIERTKIQNHGNYYKTISLNSKNWFALKRSNVWCKVYIYNCKGVIVIILDLI